MKLNNKLDISDCRPLHSQLGDLPFPDRILAIYWETLTQRGFGLGSTRKTTLKTGGFRKV